MCAMTTEPPKAKLFLEGRYRKLCRDLPQTVFFCPECKGHPRRRKKCARCEGFGKLSRDSVQELVGWVAAKAFGTRKHKFHGAGREDVDVRMLGGGRPFVFELVGPKTFDVDLAALEAEINRRNEGRLEIVGLHFSDRSRVRVVKETPHAKEYEARVAFASEPDPARIAAVLGRRVAVVQHTPDRVAHRRADKDRERWVEYLEIEPEDAGGATTTPAPVSLERDPVGAEGGSEPGPETFWRVRLRTEHGTYVKEVISGEGGRTEPSLAELVGTPCKCLALDVLGILDETGASEPAYQAGPPPFGSGV